MKRTLCVAALLAAVTAFGFQKPAHDSLPNLDRRVEGAAPKRAPSDEQERAVSALKDRVPGLAVTRSRIHGRPSFFSSPHSFLTGPDGQGNGVLPASVAGLPKNDPHRAVKAFLNEHAALLGYGAGALNAAGANVRRDYVAAHNKLRTVVFEQHLNGVPVFNALLIGHVTERGELVNLHTDFVPDPHAAAAAGGRGRGAGSTPVLSPEQAIVIAAANVGDQIPPGSVIARDAAEGASRKQTFRAAAPLKGDQYASLVWLPLSGSAMRLCWQAIIVGQEGFLIVIDAETGEVILRRSLTSHISDASYNVYTSDSPSPFSPGHFTPLTNQPLVIPRVLVVTNAFNINASPNGWIDDGVNEPRGNNVDAFTDRDDDDAPDLPRPQGVPNRVFDFPLDLALDPTNYSAAAVVNLFYWVNVMHDKLYDLGFTEVAGNFQGTNFGRGGLGNDAVQANAQDGGGFNNANMFTPPDGVPPRIQMYIFDQTVPFRDGDLDAEVILHEFTHGLSWRLVGGGGGIGGQAIQTHGMGEGWSDFYAMAVLSEPSDALPGCWATGGYLTYNFFGLLENYYFGIRRYPYSTNLLKNPLTFKDIDPTQASPHTGIPRSPIFGPFTPFDASEVHNQGEVWCVTLWEMRNSLVTRHGWTLGNQLTLQLVTDAMKLCPVDPNFLQSRDAILLADRILTGGANFLDIWTAFAKRGMGNSATSPDSSTTIGVVEAYDLPGIAFVAASVDDTLTGNGNGSIDYNECFDLILALRNQGRDTATGVVATVTTTNLGVTVVQGAAPYPFLMPSQTIAQNLTPLRITTGSNFVCGTPIFFTVTTSTLYRETNTITFVLDTGSVDINPLLLNNTTPLAIPDNNTNGASSSINVTGLGGALGKVTVSLYLTHPSDLDLIADLIAPDGTTVNLVRNEGVGANFGASCSPLAARTTFDDNAPLAIALGNAPYVGTFRPATPFDVFRTKFGTNINGAWRLRLRDTSAGNTGTLQCWTLGLYPAVCTDGNGSCGSDIAVTGVASPNPGILGTDLAYALNIENLRPLLAQGVVLTNLLSPTVTFVSATSSVGACTFTNNTVSCALGDVATGANLTATIVVRPNLLAPLTMSFTAAGTNGDVNFANNTLQITIPVDEGRPNIVPGSAQLIAESLVPSTGAIESGETVTVNLTLRNAGNAPATNLVAVLQSSGGLAPSPANDTADYGVILPGGTATRAFTFTATAAPGSAITATLQLQQGVQGLGTAVFTFGLGSSGSFGNNDVITINEFGGATPYPSTVNVSGLAGILSKVTVTLTRFTHAYPDDVDVLLVSPSGQKVMLMSDVGGGVAVTNRTLIFDPAAVGYLPDSTAIGTGVYRPTDFEGGDLLFAPAPVGGFGNSLGQFNGYSPNGTWTLFVMDDSGPDAGFITGGWTLDITTIVPVGPVVNLAVTLNPPSGALVSGEPFGYTFSVVNLGPSNATSVVLSNSMRAAFESASSTLGTVVSDVYEARVVNIPFLAVGQSATATITAHPNSPGLLTNRLVAWAADSDLDLGNNSATVVLSAREPQADLTLSVLSVPNPSFAGSNVSFLVTVTNLGPDRATAIIVTNTLPTGWTFVGATNSQGSCVAMGSFVVCSFGQLTSGASASALIVANAGVAGVVTNAFAANGAFLDPNTANHTVQVVGTINALAPIISPAGVALLWEGVAPASGAIESGEKVTVNFGLRNTGNLDATDLVATLVSSSQVVPADTNNTAVFGALTAAGGAVSRALTFTANAPAGTVITVNLHVQDGVIDLGVVPFTFALSGSSEFSSGAGIIIPSSGPATNYPSTIVVSGVSGAAAKVTVTLNQLSHTFPEDVDVLLVGPAGQKVLLMADAGAAFAVNGVTLAFDDSAATNLPFAGQIVSGTFRPTDFAPGDSFPAPAPAGPYASALAAFNGTNPNGTWSLYVFDDATGDSGAISGGWSLDIQTAAPVVSSADVAVTVSGPGVVPSGTPVTYTLSVANNGPGIATGVLVVDTLPAGFSFTSVDANAGIITPGAGLVTWRIPSLASGASASASVNGVLNAVGLVTNLAVVSAAQVDPVTANNTASITTTGLPRLQAIRFGGSFYILWPANAAAFVLETAPTPAGPWMAVATGITVVGSLNQAVLPISGNAFFRLRQP